MKFQIVETTLTDGSKVTDIDLFPNGNKNPGTIFSKPICLFSCQSEKDANLFLLGLEKLVEKHTVETLEEI